MPEKESVFKRNRNLIYFILGLIVVFWLLYVLRSVIFPFVIGLIIAYLVHPLIIWIESKLPYRGHYLSIKRISIIVLIFILIIGIIGLFIFYLVTAVSDSFIKLFTNAPIYITNGLTYLSDWFESFRYFSQGSYPC